jgi:hypothetical protein
MALWTGAIQQVNEGFAANDGTGDTIRAAFIKTDNSFAAVNSFLSASTQDFLNANISGLVQANIGSFVDVRTLTFNANTATITRIDGLLGLSIGGDVVVTGNLSATNGISSASVVTGTLQAARLGANISLNNYNIVGNGNILTTGTISTSNLVSNNTTATGTSTVQNLIVQGNLIASAGIMVTSSIVPTGNIQYDLGSPTNYFRNVYSEGLVEVNTVVLNNNDNILRLHSNIPAGDVKDVGILGKFNKNSTNSYAYFGYQYSTNNFVYKITPTDATTGTGIVSDGVYGNAQFGSLFLSNNVASGNTLVVNSGAAITGNTHSSNFIGNFVGNLTSTAATVGTVTAGNINNTGTINTAAVTATGNVVANYHLGNLVSATANITNLTANSIVATGNVVGNVVAAVANIASLSIGIVSGNLAVGGIISSTGATITGNINVANSVNGNVNSTNANVTNLTVGSVAGNLNVIGNVLSAGSQVLTLNNFSQYLPALNNATNVVGDSYFTGNMTVAGSNGFKTAGNVYAGFGSGAPYGFYGNLYGLVTNPVQSGITTVGTLGNLSVTNTTSTGTLNVNTLNATNATVSGALSAGTTTVAGLTATSLIVSGALSAGTTTVAGLTATSLIVSGNTAVSNLAVTGTISTGTTISTNATSNSLTSGNITVSGNVSASNVVATAIYSNGYRFANGAAFVSTTLANTTEITANAASGANAGLSLAATGVSAGTYGSATQVPVITVDAKGRISTVAVANISGSLTFTGDVTGTGATGSSTALTLASVGTAGTYGSATQVPVITTDSKGRVSGITLSAISSTLNVAGTAGTGTVSLLNGTLTFAGTNGVTATVSGSTVTVGTPQDLRTTATPTFTSINSNLNSTSISTNSITAGTVTVTGSIVPNTNNTINIGGAGSNFATVYATTFSGTSTTAKYADLAEIYAADAEYEPGTVVVFGGDAEITVTNQFADVGVAGAISTNPAYLMNDAATGVPVALRGRVPVRVIGPVVKGDLLVTAGQNPGYATSVGRSTEYPLAVFAKAIETNTAEGTKVIEAVII